MKVERFSDVDVKSIGFKEPQKTPEKTYYSLAERPNKEPILIQTPELECSAFNCDLTKGRCEIEMVLEDNMFYQFLRDLDAHTIQTIFKQRKSWFKKCEVSMAQVEDCYKSPIVRSEKGPIVTFKLNHTKEKIQTVFFRGRFDIESSEFTTDSPVTAILELRGMTLYKDSMCLDWVVHSVRVRESPVTDAYMFSDA